jgi:hypothetical protein
MNKPDRDFLKVDEVLDLVRTAVKEKKPFSLVRVGDGENIVLAQNSAMSVDKVLKTGWAKLANKGKKGVSLPNIKLRDEMAAGINQADIVGIPFWSKDPIMADRRLKRPLTEAVFKHLGIRPKQVCHTFVNRVFAQKKEFWDMLGEQRVVLISRWAEPVKQILAEPPYQLHIAFTIDFQNYTQINETLKTMEERKDDFDVVLLSCGVNAVLLSPAIAGLTDKIALDFGKSLMYMFEEKAGLTHSSAKANEKLIP